MKLLSGVFLCCMLLSGCAESQSGKHDSLQGKVWQVTHVEGASLDVDDMATLVFSPDGRLSGQGFCNRYMARYQVIGQQLKISPIASTKMACMPPGRMLLQSRFMQILQTAVSYQVLPNDELQILGSENRKINAKPVN